MTLTLRQLLQDQQSGHVAGKPKEPLSSGPSTNAPLAKEHLETTKDLNDASLEAIARLVDSVRKIRATTDEVIDARTRIDETQEDAKELQEIQW
ncbi:hypothetical protein EV178_004475 [Coemansia sp. RSA 1646]|nr:hypothetical protein EV178_004475 [Coemansia sp. RSA 1646]